MFNPAHPYEPLTSENSALVLVDHQIGLTSGVRDYSIAELKHNVVGLAKAAKALKLPIVATTTARDSMWGPTIPELVEALSGVQIMDRSSVNVFDDPRVAKAYRSDRSQEAYLCGSFARSLRCVSCHNSRQQGPRCVRRRGRLWYVQ